MKIVFLDIDGVINTDNSHHSPGSYATFPGSMQIYLQPLDPKAIGNLNRITETTGAKIVISSTWREPFVRYGQFDLLEKYLRAQGVLGEIIGYTPITPEYRGLYGYDKVYTRGDEIKLWLEQNKEKLQVESYVAIDDDETCGNVDPVKNHWVQTFWTDGILDEDVAKAVRHLKKITW